MISRPRCLLFSTLALHSTLAFTVVPTAQFTACSPSIRSSNLVQQNALYASPSDNDSGGSIWVKLNEAGMTLKPKAIAAKEKTESATSTADQKLRYALQSSILYTLFIVYRAFRGFCVILPAVFNEVRRKLQIAVEQPLLDAGLAIKDDVDPKTGKVRLRTSMTVTFLASLVTVKYVVSGLFRVMGKFIRGSFPAAADEVTDLENELVNMTKEPEGINGEQAGRLAPWMSCHL